MQKPLAVMINNGGCVKYAYRENQIDVYECMTTWQEAVYRGCVELAGKTVAEALDMAQDLVEHKGFSTYETWSYIGG